MSSYTTVLISLSERLRLQEIAEGLGFVRAGRGNISSLFRAIAAGKIKLLWAEEYDAYISGLENQREILEPKIRKEIRAAILAVLEDRNQEAR